MTTARLLLVGLVIAVSSVALAPPAGADCSGPRISTTSGSVDRGQSIPVEGAGFGDSCYDTGPPPSGQGPLGEPVAGIEIVITQGATEIVVARGDADAKYAFAVGIIVPPSMQPGSATVSARSSHMSAVPLPKPLTISAQPATTAEQEIATFGPNATTDPTDSTTTLTGTSTEESSGGGNPWALPITVAIGMLAFVGIVIRRRRPRR